MALVRLSCVLLAVMSLAVSIQGASFSSEKNSSSIAQNASETAKPKNLLEELVAAASDNADNLASVTGTSVTSTSGPLEQHVRPAVPPSTPAYTIPSYAGPPAVGGPGYPGLGLGGFGGPGYPGLGLGGLGGLFPGFGGNVGLDVSAGGYFPIVEKVIVVVGGGLFLLLILACIQGSLLKGGLLHGLGQRAFGILDPLNIQKGFSASASASLNKNVDLNNRVQQSINKQF